MTRTYQLHRVSRAPLGFENALVILVFLAVLASFSGLGVYFAAHTGMIAVSCRCRCSAAPHPAAVESVSPSAEDPDRARMREIIRHRHPEARP